ncbi:MAG TPA: recombinase family protein [Streptosporangiaceae bacterium]
MALTPLSGRCWESSRISREQADWVDFLDLLKAGGMPMYVTDSQRTYDPADKNDRHALLVDGANAELEAARTSGRVRSGTARAANVGQPHGRIPYGYARAYKLDEDNRRVIDRQFPAEPEASVVREIVTRIGRGEPVNVVTTDLNKRGIPRREQESRAGAASSG